MIYFIQAGENYKIGYTKDENGLNKRIKTLQTGNPHKIEIVFTVDGDLSFESKLHSAFNEHRLHGEWFAKIPTIEEVEEIRLKKIDKKTNVLSIEKLTTKQWLHLVCELWIEENPCEEITQQYLVDFITEEGSDWTDSEAKWAVCNAVKKFPSVLEFYNKNIRYINEDCEKWSNEYDLQQQ